MTARHRLRIDNSEPGRDALTNRHSALFVPAFPNSRRHAALTTFATLPLKS